MLKSSFKSSQPRASFFCSSRRRHTRYIGDWSSDVCSSDLSESDISSYQYIDFSFRFPTRIGTAGAMFRPLFDKSRQDFALMWETGSDTSSFDSQLVFTFEDMFNNLWAWRQTRVGNESEPYLRHPYEPALRLRGRGDRWRAELSGKYLTPSRK